MQFVLNKLGFQKHYFGSSSVKAEPYSPFAKVSPTLLSTSTIFKIKGAGYSQIEGVFLAGKLNI